jgi:hypothetical protein
MTKLSSPLLHPKLAPDRVTHMPMVPRLVPSPVLEAARPHKVLAVLPQHRRVAAAPAAGLALAPATLPALVPARALAEAEAEVAPVEAISPVLVLATLPALVPATSPAVVDIRSQFGGE